MNPEHVNIVYELKNRGAKTFGKTARIKERLDRFIKFELKKEASEAKGLRKRTASRESDPVDTMTPVFRTISGILILHIMVGLTIALLWLGSQNGFSDDWSMDSTHS